MVEKQVEEVGFFVLLIFLPWRERGVERVEKELASWKI